MKIAVLIPVYNAERYLSECLDSVLASGRELAASGAHSLDVFCCDDGSSDRSRDILSEYASRFPNIRFVTQENRGVVATRNRLLDELPDAYEAFAFVDSDDLVAPPVYAVLAEAMLRTRADVAECGMPGNSVSVETVVDDMTVYRLRRTATGPWINVVNKLYRREKAGAVRFREGLRFEEDFFFNYEVNAVIGRKVLVPGVYYTYRDNPDSATHALDLRRYFDSTTRRVRLSLEVFFKAGRIPSAIEGDWLAELSKDAYRMCIRKNLKKNRDAVLRRELFEEAGAFLKRMESDYGFRPVGLNVIQRTIWRACRNGGYALARVLAAVT